jgi:hypothetical protein
MIRNSRTFNFISLRICFLCVLCGELLSGTFTAQRNSFVAKTPQSELSTTIFIELSQRHNGCSCNQRSLSSFDQKEFINEAFTREANHLSESR